MVDQKNGAILIGALKYRKSLELAGTEEQMFMGVKRQTFWTNNTTLVVIMTDAGLDKLQATKVAQMAQDGMARTIRPAHTQFDGDLIFALSVGTKPADLDTVGTAAAEVTARAIINAAKSAQGLGGVPSYQDIRNSVA